MVQYATRRLVALLPTLVAVSLIIFSVMRILPGDVATIILMGPGGEGGAAKAEDRAKLNAELGLDRPLPVQYVDWVWGVVRLDAGNSLWSREPVFAEIGKRLPLTFELTLLSSIVALVVAVPTGVISAARRGSWMDYAARLFSIFGLAMPSFWVGTLIILALVTWFNWTPPLGYAQFTENPVKNLQQLIWPALALGYAQAAVVSRMLRSSLLEVLREDYVRTAHAKGLRERNILMRHALRNALLPVVTLFAIQVAVVLGGTVVLETVFTLPGLGRYLVDGIGRRDYPVVQTLVLLFAVLFVLVNLLVDLLYAVMDPRIRFGGA